MNKLGSVLALETPPTSTAAVGEFTLEDVESYHQLHQNMHEVGLLSMAVESMCGVYNHLESGALSLESCSAVAGVSELFLRQETFYVGDSKITSAINPMSLESDEDKKKGLLTRIWEAMKAAVKRVGAAFKSMGDFILRIFSTTDKMLSRLDDVDARLKKLDKVEPATIEPTQAVVSGLFVSKKTSLGFVIGNVEDNNKILWTLFTHFRSLAVEQMRLVRSNETITADHLAATLKGFEDEYKNHVSFSLPGNQSFVAIDRGKSLKVLLADAFGKVMDLPSIRMVTGFTGERPTEGSISYKDIGELRDMARMLRANYDMIKKTRYEDGLRGIAKATSDWVGSTEESINMARLRVAIVSVPTPTYFTMITTHLFRVFRSGVMLLEQILDSLDKSKA